MGILIGLVAAVIHVLAVALDVTTLFLLVHLICTWRPWRPLVAMDQVGTPMVHYVTGTLGRLWRQVVPQHWLSEKQLSALALALVCLVKLVLGIVFKVMVLI